MKIPLRRTAHVQLIACTFFSTLSFAQHVIPTAKSTAAPRLAVAIGSVNTANPNQVKHVCVFKRTAKSTEVKWFSSPLYKVTKTSKIIAATVPMTEVKVETPIRIIGKGLAIAVLETKMPEGKIKFTQCVVNDDSSSTASERKHTSLIRFCRDNGTVSQGVSRRLKNRRTKMTVNLAKLDLKLKGFAKRTKITPYISSLINRYQKLVELQTLQIAALNYDIVNSHEQAGLCTVRK